MLNLFSSLFKNSSSSSSSSYSKSSSFFKSDDKDDKKSYGKSSDKDNKKDCDDDRNDKGKDKGKDKDDDCDDKGHGKGKGHHHGNGNGHDSHGNGNGYGHHHGCGDDDDGQTDNKPAVFSGDSAGTVQEDGTLTASGTLTVTDPDAGESEFASTGDLQGEYGEFSFDLDTGAWSYELDNANTAVQALDGGETLEDTLLVTSTDGSNTELAVTINGADEAPPVDPALVWVIDLDSNSVVRVDNGATAPISYFGNDGYATLEGFTSNDVLNHNGIQLDGTYESDVDGDELGVEGIDDTVASFSYVVDGVTHTLEVGLIDFVGIDTAVNLATDVIPV
jgi:VCBS repeat-containing protein